MLTSGVIHVLSTFKQYTSIWGIRANSFVDFEWQLGYSCKELDIAKQLLYSKVHEKTPFFSREGKTCKVQHV